MGICLDVRDREIVVSPSSDNQVHIDYSENSKEYYNISVSDDHMLTMTMASNKGWTDYIGKKPAISSRKIFLQLPEALLSELKLSTTNENISLSALTVADITLYTNGGDILFDKLNAEKSITLNAKNGDISGSIAGSYNNFAISCQIKKGESNLPSTKEGGTKALHVSNNNGDIDIVFVDE